jgi:CMP-N-acetylneuraminic acid synthetase
VTSVCVIPARLNSKRIAQKVLQRVGGRTLLERGLVTAIGSRSFDVVALTTADEELAEYGRRVGVEIVARPPRLEGDDAGAAEVVLHACDELRRRGIDAHVVSCLSPVYPFLRAETVADAHLRFLASNADFLMSTVPTDPHDFHWALRETGEYAELFFGDQFLMDRMYLPPILTPTGAIKMGRPEALARHGFFFGEKLVPYGLGRQESLYVGDESDLEFAMYVADRDSAGRESAALARQPLA